MIGGENHEVEGSRPRGGRRDELQMEREVVDYGHTISGAVIVRCSVLVVVLLESSVAPRELLRVGVQQEVDRLLEPVRVERLAVVEGDTLLQLDLDRYAVVQEFVVLQVFGFEGSGHVVQRGELSVDEPRRDAALERRDHVGDEVRGQRADHDGDGLRILRLRSTSLTTSTSFSTTSVSVTTLVTSTGTSFSTSLVQATPMARTAAMTAKRIVLNFGILFSFVSYCKFLMPTIPTVLTCLNFQNECAALFLARRNEFCGAR